MKTIPPEKKEEIEYLFWNTIDNTKSTIARITGVYVRSVECYIDIIVNEHFDRINRRYGV